MQQAVASAFGGGNSLASPCFDWGMLMDDITKQKLFVWGQLYRQCEQLEIKLDEHGSDPEAIQSELTQLRERTEAAFKEAYQSLKRADSETGPA
jgi:hypothetical protein